MEKCPPWQQAVLLHPPLHPLLRPIPQHLLPRLFPPLRYRSRPLRGPDPTSLPLLSRLCPILIRRRCHALSSLPSSPSKSAKANMCPYIRSDSKITTPEVDTHNDVTIDTINTASVGTGARKVTIIPKYVTHNVKVKSTSQYIRNFEAESVSIPAIPFPIPTTASVAIKKYGISPTTHDTG
ncbi:hypothetical protein LOK49_LG08G00730 [Camellia lanceoleosa]|uniref:Uncharacterized protein n=1 Tax=Camellia lanceoleosa TaxID=1840588 RepID=A0ACC0GS22_9ERIC|nr:hypothetical protein LOK49_LG08G00730 [Camellia lanceoleosa]